MDSATKIIGIHWDNGEPPIYFRSRSKGSARRAERASVTALPPVALPPGTNRLRYSDLKLLTDVTTLFRELDDLLHRAGRIREDRHTILLKLLLVKLYDEERAQENHGSYMLIQDFRSVDPAWDGAVERIFTAALHAALALYDGVLAESAPRTIACSAEVLREVSGILCGVRLLGALPQVIQDLFMYFGRFHYRVDLGQYFTPCEVIRLIVEIVNPRANERVIDPACGTADFLVGAKQVAEERHRADISSHLHGYDITPLAVHLSIFNLLLSGDRGYADVQTRDTLLHPLDHEGQYHVALCNPPFGSRIVEKRAEALNRFELVTAKKSGLGLMPKAQEAGLLYVEKCLRAVMPGGRVGILVPNGYLGNRSERYLEFRRWLLRNARVAAVIGFPRFTFKKSGADVSASALILERREEPLPDLSGVADHPIHFNLVEKVGWDLQSKYGNRIYKRDPRDGTEILDETGARIPDTDFEAARLDALTSAAVDAFPWMAQGERLAHRGLAHRGLAHRGLAHRGQARASEGWSVQAAEILTHPDLCLDPKRWCRKHIGVLKSTRAVPHLQVGQVIRPVSRSLRKKPEVSYRYVEIEKIYEAFGAYVSDECFGWELPDRARHVAAPGDIFIANIWSSAGKWMIAGDEAQDGRLIVTTGCTHFELIPGQEDRLPELVFGLCSEAFKVQMRALATGSDGLSSVAVSDICSIVLPRMQSPVVRAQIERRISEARAGQVVLHRVVRDELAVIAPETNVPLRSSHVVQV
jgi:type I restriction enzyme M protein